jgi:hypothetical protein
VQLIKQWLTIPIIIINMIQDQSAYRRVGTPGLNKVGMVAIVGVAATIGIIASFSQT